MDWSDEHYVKWYTRDTATSLLWPWQTVALFPNLLKRCTKIGLVEVRSKDFWAGLSAVVRLPIEVIKPGMEHLIEDGTVELVPNGVFMPKFLEAQEAKKTKAASARDYREKQRALARGIGNVPRLLEATVSTGDGASSRVMAGDPPARPLPVPCPTPALPDPDPSPALPDRQTVDPATEKSSRKLSWHFELYESMQEGRRKRMRDLELDPITDEKLAPGFITASLKKIRDACGGSAEAVAEIYDAYLSATWPAAKSPPYCFQSFVSDKTWPKLKAEIESAR